MRNRPLVPFMMVLGLSTFALAACGGGAASSGGANTPSDDKGGGDHPLVGNPAPDFSLDTVNDQGKVSIKGMEGKVLIVDFWATWCEPCKKSFPKLQELNVKYKASGLEIIGVSEDDDKSGIKDFASNLGAKFALGWDDGKAIAGKWDPKSMPSTFVVDRKGVVRFAHLGYHDGDEAEIEKEIKGLL